MSDISLALKKNLGAYLLTKAPTLTGYLVDWPEPNEEMSLPSLTIVTGRPSLTRCSPYLVTKGSVSSHQATNLYCVGQVDITLQVDLWCKYRKQRSDLFDLLVSAFQPTDPKGLVLDLGEDYHDEIANYLLTDWRFPDSPETSSRQEWRAIFGVEVTCRVIGSTTDYMITQVPVLDFDTPEGALE